MRPPSRRVQANRRRWFIWLPLTVVGAIFYALGFLINDLYLPAIDLHVEALYVSLIGMITVMTGFPGLIADTGREVYVYPYWPEDLEKERAR